MNRIRLWLHTRAARPGIRRLEHYANHPGNRNQHRKEKP